MTNATAFAQKQELSCQPDFQIAVSYDPDKEILEVKFDSQTIELQNESTEFLHLYFKHLAETTTDPKETFSKMRVMSFQSTPLTHFKNFFPNEFKAAQALNPIATVPQLKTV